jgi:hypothetical protein
LNTAYNCFCLLSDPPPKVLLMSQHLLHRLGSKL